jgi:hypothetical protein
MFLTTVYAAMHQTMLLVRGQALFSDDFISPFVLVSLSSLMGISFLLRQWHNHGLIQKNDKQLKEEFGAFYESLRTYYASGIEVLWWPSSWFFKRWILCFIAIVPFVDFAWGQVTLLVIINFLQACWTCYLMPYDKKWLNRLQIMNDWFLMVASYFLYTFIGVSGPDPNIAYEASMWLNYMIYFMIFNNCVIAIINAVIEWQWMQKLEESKAAKIQEREQRRLLYNGRNDERDEIHQ